MGHFYFYFLANVNGNRKNRYLSMDFSISIALGSMPKMGMNIPNIKPERNAFLAMALYLQWKLYLSLWLSLKCMCVCPSAIIEKLNTVYTTNDSDI